MAGGARMGKPIPTCPEGERLFSESDDVGHSSGPYPELQVELEPASRDVHTTHERLGMDPGTELCKEVSPIQSVEAAKN